MSLTTGRRRRSNAAPHATISTQAEATERTANTPNAHHDRNRQPRAKTTATAPTQKPTATPTDAEPTTRQSKHERPTDAQATTQATTPAPAPATAPTSPAKDAARTAATTANQHRSTANATTGTTDNRRKRPKTRNAATEQPDDRHATTAENPARQAHDPNPAQRQKTTQQSTSHAKAKTTEPQRTAAQGNPHMPTPQGPPRPVPTSHKNPLFEVAKFGRIGAACSLLPLRRSATMGAPARRPYDNAAAVGGMSPEFKFDNVANKKAASPLLWTSRFCVSLQDVNLNQVMSLVCE